MLETIEEITKAVKDKKAERSALEDRWNNDFKIWRMEQYDRGKGYQSHTSNEFKALGKKVVTLLSSSKRIIRIPLELDDEEKRKAKSNAERYVAGALNLADLRLEAMLQPNIQNQLAFMSAIRGWYAIRAYMRRGKDGIIPDVAMWDILNTYWEIGSEGLLWGIFTRTASKSQIEAEWGITINGKNGLVYDSWDTEKNSVVVDNQWAKKPKKHGLKHIPVTIGQVGSVPFIESSEFEDTIKDVGESIYDTLRLLPDETNRIMSDYFTLIDRGVHNPYAVYSKGGKKGLGKSPYSELGNEIKLDVDKGEKIEDIFQPTMPRDALVYWSALKREESIAGLPDVAYGLIDKPLPGIAISLLHHAAETIILAPQAGMERALTWLVRELLTQFTSGKFGKLRVYGRDAQDKDFDIELSPKDVKGDWLPKVKLMARLPEDEMARFTMAQMAVESGLMSRETAGDRLLGIQDTDAEQEKRDREQAKELPGIKEYRMAIALKNEGNLVMADALMQRAMAQMTQQPGVTPFQTRRREQQEEAVRPQFAQGVARTELPMEFAGSAEAELPI